MAKTDTNSLAIGFIAGMFCGPCGIGLAMLYSPRTLVGGIVGWLVGMLLGFYTWLPFFTEEAGSSLPPLEVEEPSVRRMRLDGAPVPPQRELFPPALLAGIVGGVMALLGSAGAAWMWWADDGAEQEGEEISEEP
ncbi:MAG: hypothetical protein KTR31_02940 [Myxococcales bacterium]|nr:hypothetical protein [Myxococcales bacterium]